MLTCSKLIWLSANRILSTYAHFTVFILKHFIRTNKQQYIELHRDIDLSLIKIALNL